MFIPILIYRNGTTVTPTINVFKHGLTLAEHDLVASMDLGQEVLYTGIAPQKRLLNSYRTNFQQWHIKKTHRPPWFLRNEDVYTDNARIAAKEYMDSIPLGEAHYDYPVIPNYPLYDVSFQFTGDFS